MKNLRRRVKNIRTNFKKFMMAHSARNNEPRTNFDMFLASDYRERDRVEPSAPPIDENNSSSQADSGERHYFSTETGFYTPSESEEQQPEDVVDGTEAAQNDYNSQVERIMQESRQVQSDLLLARRIQSQDPPPFPVEVDLVGVEASTSLLLLGVTLVFVSRLYAALYVLVVGAALYRLRRSHHARETARRERIRDWWLSGGFLQTPQIVRDLRQAVELLWHTVAAMVLLPVLVCTGLAALIHSARGSTQQQPRRGTAAAAQRGLAARDCKFLLGLIFFPLCIPYWLSKVPRPGVGVGAGAGRARNNGAGVLVLFTAVARFLAGRRR